MLYKYLEQNPDVKIDNYLKITSVSFQNSVKTALQNLKRKDKENTTSKMSYSSTSKTLRGPSELSQSIGPGGTKVTSN